MKWRLNLQILRGIGAISFRKSHMLQKIEWWLRHVLSGKFQPSVKKTVKEILLSFKNSEHEIKNEALHGT
jgi:hypothetical protein